MLIQKLFDSGAIRPPAWLPANVQFLAEMGSNAFGYARDSSDKDLHGFCIPPQDVIFPHLAGAIPGFGSEPKLFDEWEHHHVKCPDGKNVEYDFKVFGIVRFVHLAGILNNPNAMEVLFAPRRCIVHTTPVADHLRDSRSLFLHKGAMDRLRGYAAQQMQKLKRKTGAESPKRKALIEAHGYDTSYATHVVRLYLEAEQVLIEHDLTLDRNGAVLREIRDGGWTFERLVSWVEAKSVALETLHASSTLRSEPDEPALHRLLIECLEMHFGSLSAARSSGVVTNRTDGLMRELRDLVGRYS